MKQIVREKKRVIMVIADNQFYLNMVINRKYTYEISAEPNKTVCHVIEVRHRGDL